MSDILDMAHDMAKDLNRVGMMDDTAMRMMDHLCVPGKPRLSLFTCRQGIGNCRVLNEESSKSRKSKPEIFQDKDTISDT